MQGTIITTTDMTLFGVYKYATPSNTPDAKEVGSQKLNLLH